MWQCSAVMGRFVLLAHLRFAVTFDSRMYILGHMGPPPITTVLLILLFFYEWFLHLCEIAVTILLSHRITRLSSGARCFFVLAVTKLEVLRDILRHSILYKRE